MIPNEQQLIDAQHAINSQFPALSVIAEGETALFALTSLQAATIASALGVATTAVREGLRIVAREGLEPTPLQVGWAAIIESTLAARGAPWLQDEWRSALRRVEPSVLERMACLVLERLSPGHYHGMLERLAPDTPETVAAKCVAARGVVDAFRKQVVEPLGAKRDAALDPESAALLDRVGGVHEVAR